MGYINNLGNYRLGNYLSAQGRATYIQFDGTAYAEHAPWSPEGVNFTIRLKHTPASTDIGNLVTVLGAGVIEKDASNNLVFNYTDTAAQSVTLSALALVADTEYLIEVSSDGNGVRITVGADTALNAAVIDPATLIIESWMGAANPSAGVIRDIDFIDRSEIQDGTFLQGDGSTIDVSIPTITSTNFSLLIPFVFDSSKTNQSLISSGSITDFIRVDGPSGLSIRINNVQSGVTATFVDGQHYLLRIIKAGDEVATYIDNFLINTLTFAAWTSPVNFSTLFSLGASGQDYRGTASIELTDTDTGNTYEYLLNNVTDSGTAPNTGNTGSSFDGTVQNYDALTDLVQIPPNTRRYPVSAASNIQPDVLNADGAELFAPVLLDAGWTDNLDGSYSWDASSTQYLDCGNVVTTDKYYLCEFDISEYTGTGQLVFSGSAFDDAGRSSLAAVGVMRVILYADQTQLRIAFFGGTGTGTVRNISVRETTSAEIINYDPSMVQ